MAKGTRKNITIPGLLAATLKLRSRECGFRTLSPYVLDLVAFDLQRGARHTVTLAIAADTPAAQDAVDAELAIRYQPGQQREGLLVQVIEHLRRIRTTARYSRSAVPLSAKPERITFPAPIWSLVEIRWQELGYNSLSAYITGLLRYDLLIGGPHRASMATGRRKEQDRLARETIHYRESGTKPKLYLDHLIERTEGRSLDDAELEAMKARVVTHLQVFLKTSPLRNS